MGSLVCPCCCYFRAAVRCLHWAALSSWKASLLKNGQWDVCTCRRAPAKESVFGSSPNLVGRKWRSRLYRISHPDWAKLSVELNGTPNQNTKFFLSLQVFNRLGFFPCVCFLTGPSLLVCYTIRQRKIEPSKPVIQTVVRGYNQNFLLIQTPPLHNEQCKIYY